jgi:hypothetical protein
LQRQSGGFALVDVKRTSGLQGFDGILGGFGFQQKSVTPEEPLKALVAHREGVELFAYYINFPHPDYYFWREWHLAVRDFVLDWDSTKERLFFSLYPNLDFWNDGGSHDTENSARALSEVLKRYFLAAHYAVAIAMNAFHWYNLRTFPAADIIHKDLRRSNMQNWFDAINGFPISSSVYKYLLGQQRLLKFTPSKQSIMYAMPLYLHEYSLHTEGIKDPDCTTLSITDASCQNLQLPEFYESHNDVTYEAGKALYDAMAAETDGESLISKYIIRQIKRCRSNIMTALGWSSPTGGVNIGSELRELLETKIGLFDEKFDLRKIQSDVNAQPIYDGADFVSKMMVFADRPRPVMKYNKCPSYLCADPEDAQFFYSPWYHLDSTPTTTIEVDNYVYLYLPDVTTATAVEAIRTGDWDTLETDLTADDLDNSEGSAVLGNAFDWYILTEWFKPYKDWFLPDENYFDQPLSGERGGTMFMVKDEFTRGYFMPRYMIHPTIDNLDVFQCGFYKVLQAGDGGEWLSADEWSEIAYAYENYDFNAGDFTDNWWKEKSSTFKNMLMWVGSGIVSLPWESRYHALSDQVSYYAQDIGYLRDADKTKGAVPFVPFIYAHINPSLNFAAVDADDTWNSTNLHWDDSAIDKGEEVYDHDRATAAGYRRARWLSLNFWDPSRQVKVRFTNFPFYMMSLYQKQVERFRTSWNELFQNESILTVPPDEDDTRYLSDYKLMAMNKRPLAPGGVKDENPFRRVLQDRDRE